MNCKPNETAFIVRVSCQALECLLGTPVTTRRMVTMPSGVPGWTLDKTLSATILNGVENRDGVRYDAGSKLLFDVVPDSWLQPIRGQSDPVHEIEVSA